MSTNYQNKENRDRNARIYTDKGHKVRKGSIRGQVLSPDYVIDYPEDKGTPNGFGGRSPELFPILYTLEVLS